jgi:hypothetical protein
MIDFSDHIIEKFPFRLSERRTDDGREFEATFKPTARWNALIGPIRKRSIHIDVRSNRARQLTNISSVVAGIGIV